jgi:hypothetical protein
MARVVISGFIGWDVRDASSQVVGLGDAKAHRSATIIATGVIQARSVQPPCRHTV